MMFRHTQLPVQGEEDAEMKEVKEVNEGSPFPLV